MKKIVYRFLPLKLGALGILLLLSCTRQKETVKTVDTAEFGVVEIHGSCEVPKGFVFVFSGENGIRAEDRKAVRRLTGDGLLIALINTRLTLNRLKTLRQEHECLDLTGSLEWLARNAQHDCGLTRYQEPLLVGQGAGGTLVYIALAQAPPLAFSGGLSVDFAPVLDLDRRFCGVTGEHKSGEAQRLLPTGGFPRRWQMGGTKPISPEAGAFAKKHAHLNHLPVSDSFPEGSLPELYMMTLGQLLKDKAGEAADSLSDLPVVEVSQEPTKDVLVIIYSGDGGWRDIDRSLGTMLSAKGYAVVGVDCLRYFWHYRTPEETANDLARIIKHYRRTWKSDEVVLIGYSFGADIIPLAYNRLPSSLQSSILLMTLLSPSRRADFEIHLSEWFSDEASPRALPLPPEIIRIPHDKLQCVYGEEEADTTLCTHESMRQAERIERPGSHHFDNDYAVLADNIAAAIERRMNPSPSGRK